MTVGRDTPGETPDTRTPSEGESFLLGREQFGMRFGLDRMRRLLAGLGDPQQRFDAVHVVGTNGKSTTTLMAGAALESQGLGVGCFTSPHLLSFRERIDLNGEIIEPDVFEDGARAVRLAVERLDAESSADDRVTQFEAITALALLAFAEAGVDVAVVEAGLGGRLDATNVLQRSVVQVLTGVGIDHTEYLGETIEQIAREKLDVVRTGAALVCGMLGPEAEIVANRISDERDARMTQLRVVYPQFAGLAGDFVRRNASLALDAAESAFAQIRPQARFDREAGAGAIVQLVAAKRLSGRLQIANTTPFEVRDSAHNQQAAEALVASLPELIEGRAVTLLVAMMSDKPIRPVLTTLLGVLPDGGAIVCTQAANPRSLSARDLADAAAALSPADVKVEAEPSPLAALDRARRIAGSDGALVVTGSNYLLADLLRDPGDVAGAAF